MDLTGLGSLFDFGGKLIDKLFPDPQKAQEAKIELFKLQQNGELAQLAADTAIATGQMEINKVEAASSSLFVSGWRPSIGWVCSAAFAMNFVIGPLATFSALAITGKAIPWPTLDTATMLPVLLGLLGLGAMRSTEKIKGVA